MSMTNSFIVITALLIASAQCFSPQVRTHIHSPSTPMAMNGKHVDIDVNPTPNKTRRDIFNIAGASLLATSSLLVQPQLSEASDYSSSKVLVLGGSGFVGSEVCKILKSLGVDYVATSRDGRGDTQALDFTNPNVNVSTEVEALAKGCTAVISCIGAIGTSDDQVVNAGTGLAAIGAKTAGVSNFVYISVAPEVRDSAKSVSFLRNYMEGKSFSEDTIKANFGGSSTIIEPTFIYGGDEFKVNPPRVADGYGKLVEGLLSSGPFRAAASVSPGIIGVALEPPVRVSAVAGAAVSGALGLSGSTLDTYDKINAASKLI